MQDRLRPEEWGNTRVRDGISVMGGVAVDDLGAAQRPQIVSKDMVLT